MRVAVEWPAGFSAQKCAPVALQGIGGMVFKRDIDMNYEYPYKGLPPAQGLYDPEHEHDACGIGFIADIQGRKSHEIVLKGVQILINLTHRGACGCDPQTGDGAGILDRKSVV
jgi:hypothetical protein